MAPRGKERVAQTETVAWKHTSSCVKQTASGKPLNNTGAAALRSVTTKGVGWGRVLAESSEGVDIRTLTADSHCWQKPTL